MRQVDDLAVAETVAEFAAMLPDKIISRRSGGSQKYKAAVLSCTATHDIETTNTKNDGFAYTFALNVAGCNAVFRYWEDYAEALDLLVDRYNLSNDRELHIHIHNLGYEMQYELQLISARWGIKTSLWTDAHKCLQVRCLNGIVFCDSLRLFAKSLAGATTGLPHAKATGDLEYTKYRTPETPLTPAEWRYIVYDVQGLWEAIERLKSEGKYTSASLPLTNTARVVRSVRNKCSSDIQKYSKRLALPKAAVIPAYRAMAGGDTHGCRWRAGRTYRNCNSYDFKSAHPSQMITKRYPMTAPTYYGQATAAELRRIIDDGCMFFGLLALTDVAVRVDCPDPVISLSKCDYITPGYTLDNGRVLTADALAVYCDSNDYIRIMEAYETGQILGDVWISKLDYLPQSLTDAVFHWFLQKENPKIKGTPEYTFAKICVNTIFGASAQKRVRDEYTITGTPEAITGTRVGWLDKLKSLTPEAVLSKQANNLPFLWGMWTSSCSRLELWKLLKIVGWERVIYWDTDSCKYKGPKLPEVDAYNADQRELVETRGYAREGLAVIGSAEDEHPGAEYGYSEFRALHSKCYAARDADGDLTATIAGVSKSAGKKALHDNIERLADGLTIKPAGGSKLWYQTGPIIRRSFGERETQTASWIYMEDREYHLKADTMDNAWADDVDELVGEIIAY